MCINGTWQDVVVDDYFPVKPKTDAQVSGLDEAPQKLAFGSARLQPDGKASLWVALLEKAWAKLCGNYDRIVMGTVDMGFIHLCGVPSIGFKHKEWGVSAPLKNNFWVACMNAYRSKHILTAGTIDEGKEMEAAMANGLRANHCYTIMSLHDINVKGKQDHLLKLRNPWGH